MKTKQVEKLLKGVMTDFFSHIADEKIEKIISHGYITGGCIPSMLIGEWVNDYDIYLISEKHAKAVRRFFQQRFDTGNKYEKYNVSLITENSINLTDKIQIITKFVGVPDQVIHKFDWAHIKSVYDIGSEKLELCENIFQLLMEKELVYTGSEYPLSSLLRTRKFIKKGWSISNAQMVNIALEIVAAFHATSCLNIKSPYQKYKADNPDEDINEETLEELISADLKYNSGDGRIEDDFDIDVMTLLQQLNGVDPLTIQAQLLQFKGRRLPIDQIIKLIS
ncbi:hypothetical protein HN803_07665 [candidate division WWE3 bacterium]|nr:hypothetical protein [candidate division WWE3 bacterium]